MLQKHTVFEHPDVFQASFLKVNEAICFCLQSGASCLSHPLVLWRLMAWNTVFLVSRGTQHKGIKPRNSSSSGPLLEGPSGPTHALGLRENTAPAAGGRPRTVVAHSALPGGVVHRRCLVSRSSQVQVCPCSIQDEPNAETLRR